MQLLAMLLRFDEREGGGRIALEQSCDYEADIETT